jgi:hypothetical protein
MTKSVSNVAVIKLVVAVSLVNLLGTWTSANSRHKDKIEIQGLVQREMIKNQKHTEFNTPICFIFLAFAVSYLDYLALLLVDVFSPVLTSGCNSMIPFLHSKAIHLSWILLTVLSVVPIGTDRSHSIVSACIVSTVAMCLLGVCCLHSSCLACALPLL